MVSSLLRKGLPNQRDREEEPSKRKASPLKSVSNLIGIKPVHKELTASGCFHGQDKLLSIAPI
jgi:hypothetical protein